MRIVVTGAAGFIGRNVVAELNARGQHDLLLVDALGSDDKWKNLLGLQFDDLISPAAYRGRLAGMGAPAGPQGDVVIHLGACSATTERDADFLLDNNTHFTREVIESCLSHGARCVYASSGATYGDGSLGYSDDDARTPQLRPLNMYGYSKHLVDLWALRHDLFAHGLVGLKYFNVFGPFEGHKGEMRSVVEKSFHQIRETGTIRLFKSHRPEYADGEQMRDFIYVKDAVDVTLHFALGSAPDGAPGGLFNCGTGQARTWKALALAVFSALEIEPRIEFMEMPATLRGKYQYFTQAEVGKLRKAGYGRPFTTLEDGVRDYVRGYLMGGDDAGGTRAI